MTLRALLVPIALAVAACGTVESDGQAPPGENGSDAGFEGGAVDESGVPTLLYETGSGGAGALLESGDDLYWLTRAGLKSAPKSGGTIKSVLAWSTSSIIGSGYSLHALDLDQTHAYLIRDSLLVRVPLAGGATDEVELPAPADTFLRYASFGTLRSAPEDIYVNIGCRWLVRVSKEFAGETPLVLDNPAGSIGELSPPPIVDDTNVFCASANQVFSMPLNLGTPTELLSIPDFNITGLEADDSTLYLMASRVQQEGGVIASPQQLLSLPKAGGPATVLAEGLQEEGYALHADFARSSFYWLSDNALVAYLANGALERYLDPSVGALLTADEDRLYWTTSNAIMNMHK